MSRNNNNSNNQNSNNQNSRSTNNQGMENFKMEVANELGVDLQDSNITAKEAGSVGGEMVRKMIKDQENKMSNK